MVLMHNKSTTYSWLTIGELCNENSLAIVIIGEIILSWIHHTKDDSFLWLHDRGLLGNELMSSLIYFLFS